MGTVEQPEIFDSKKNKLEIKPGDIVEFGNYVYGMNLIKKPEFFTANRNTEILDWDKIKNRRLFLRYWCTGDKFQPLGLVGHQKVSDFLINNKRKIIILLLSFLVLSMLFYFYDQQKQYSSLLSVP